MALVKWNPTRDLLDIEREFSRMFNNLGRFSSVNKSDDEKEGYENAVWAPLTDISEDKDHFFLKMDLPGVTKDDLKLSVKDGNLTISGERKSEDESKDLKHYRVERTFGRYYRSFTLPKDIKADEIKAQFKDGTLTVSVPKAEEAKPKEIEISVN